MHFGTSSPDEGMFQASRVDDMMDEDIFSGVSALWSLGRVLKGHALLSEPVLRSIPLL